MQDKLTYNPNPNNGSFTLQLPKTYTNGTIYVTDMLGKEIYTTHIAQTRSTLVLNVSKGIYYLRYEDNAHLKTLQFIVQ